jgi:hypothetical protein
VAGAGCGGVPFDVSPEPVIVTVTDYEFQIGEDYIHGQVAISIENQTRELLWYHGCGSFLDRRGPGDQWQAVWSSICNLVEEVSIGPGEVLDASLSIHAYPLRKTRQPRWATPIDGTYRLRVFIRNAHEVLSTDGVASKPFSVATEHP